MTRVTHGFVVCTSITEVATQRGGGVTFVFLPVLGTRLHTPMWVSAAVHTHPTQAPSAPCTHTRTLHSSSTHRHAHGQWAKGGGLSPVRVFLYVIIRGGTIKEARVEGLPLLPSGEDSRNGAESHLLFLLFPFLVFKIL